MYIHCLFKNSLNASECNNAYATSSGLTKNWIVAKISGRTSQETFNLGIFLKRWMNIGNIKISLR